MPSEIIFFYAWRLSSDNIEEHLFAQCPIWYSERITHMLKLRKLSMEFRHRNLFLQKFISTTNIKLFRNTTLLPRQYLANIVSIEYIYAIIGNIGITNISNIRVLLLLHQFWQEIFCYFIANIFVTMAFNCKYR